MVVCWMAENSTPTMSPTSGASSTSSASDGTAAGEGVTPITEEEVIRTYRAMQNECRQVILFLFSFKK